MRKYSTSDIALYNKAKKALKSLEKRQDEPFTVLKEKVAEIARKGAKKEFYWRHLTIRFFPTPGGHYFMASNPITGVTSKYYIKNYMGVTGAIKWQSLASDIKRT